MVVACFIVEIRTREGVVVELNYRRGEAMEEGGHMERERARETQSLNPNPNIGVVILFAYCSSDLQTITPTVVASNYLGTKRGH